MNTYDVVRADTLEGGEHILVIRQVKREIIRIPLESVKVTDLGAAIKVKGESPNYPDGAVFFLFPDEEVELWEA